MYSVSTLFSNILIILLWLVLSTFPALAISNNISRQKQMDTVPSPTVSTKGEEFFGVLEYGPELINDRLGLRLAGNSNWYAPNGIFGLRLDAGLVQNELRHDMAKFLLSMGTNPDQVNQLVFSAGWLQRYAWERFPIIGEQGHHQDQYMLGGEYKCNLQPISSGPAPGIIISLSSAYYWGKSIEFPTKWCKASRPEKDEHGVITRESYCYSYGVGGGSRFEALAGGELTWHALSLELRAGLRHREWEDWGDGSLIQGHHGLHPGESDAPRAIIQLTWHNFLSCEMSPYYSWEPDLYVLGGSIQRGITPQLSLIARTEVVQGRGLPDDICYFCGLVYSFGAQSNPSPKSDWLIPVHGTNNEYLAPHLRQPRMTSWPEFEIDFTQKYSD
jgi:hypothetical protein